MPTQSSATGVTYASAPLRPVHLDRVRPRRDLHVAADAPPARARHGRDSPSVAPDRRVQAVGRREVAGAKPPARTDSASCVTSPTSPWTNSHPRRLGGVAQRGVQHRPAHAAARRLRGTSRRPGGRRRGS